MQLQAIRYGRGQGAIWDTYMKCHIRLSFLLTAYSWRVCAGPLRPSEHLLLLWHVRCTGGARAGAAGVPVLEGGSLSGLLYGEQSTWAAIPSHELLLLAKGVGCTLPALQWRHPKADK